jgi:NitT/TauT family transport system substrate-binding protein
MNLRTLSAASALLLTAVLSGCGMGTQDPRAAGDAELAIGMYPGSVLTLPANVAQSTGIFARNGLKVEFVDSKSGPEIISGLIGGTTQIAGGSPGTVIPPLAQGQRLLSIPPYGNMDFTVYATEASGITDLRGLVGKRVAVPARGASAEVFVRELLQEKGIDPDSVEFVATGNNQIPLLRKGDAEATVSPHTGKGILTNAGVAIRPIANPAEGTAGEVGKYAYSSFFLTTKKFTEQNPQQLRTICRSFAEAANWIADPKNATAGAKIITEITRLRGADAAEVWKYESKKWQPTFDDGRWQRNVDWVQKHSKSKRQEIPFGNACTA